MSEGEALDQDDEAGADAPAIFVVEDDADVRRSLRRLLKTFGYDMTGYPSAEAFLEQADKDAHGCLIVDVRLPGLSGLELHRTLREQGYRQPVIFITGHGDIPMGVRAIKDGAVDFLPKPFDHRHLKESLEEALRRDQDARARAARLADIKDRFAQLTARERQVFERVVAGFLNKQIAADLGIVEKTVKVHRARAMKKLGLRSITAAVRLWEELKGEL